MNISTISRNIIPVESNVIKQGEQKTKDADQKKIPKNNTDFFTNTVSQLSDSLININQVANSHPLGRSDYRPIDTFEEAKSLLPYFQSSDYQSVALDVHSELNSQAASYLFTE